VVCLEHSTLQQKAARRVTGSRQAEHHARSDVKIRKYTAPFARYTNIYQATAFLQAMADTRWYVNTEGTVIQTSQPAFHLYVIATTKAWQSRSEKSAHRPPSNRCAIGHRAKVNRQTACPNSEKPTNSASLSQCRGRGRFIRRRICEA
jgi:hypothetical protein